MSIYVENINAIINIGDAFKLGEAVGRIVGFDESSTMSPDGQYPIVLWGTPHGNVIRTGRCHIERIVSEQDFELLAGFEQDAIDKGVTPYEGAIEINK